MTEPPPDPKKSTGLIHVENNVDISEFGKETDKSLADIMRAALYPGAGEFGLLLKDTIGLVGDRVRLKRQQNVALAMDQTRQKLEAHQVEMKDITPPDEEELHMVIEGMSLAKTDELRNMWAGMLAKALDPASDVTIERPFVTTLESLSAQDVKIVDLLAMIDRSFTVLKFQQEGFTPKDQANLTDIEIEEAQAVGARNLQRRSDVVVSIFEKADSYGLSGTLVEGWTGNLFRLGVVELAIEKAGFRSLNGLAGMHKQFPDKALKTLEVYLEEDVKRRHLQETEPDFLVRRSRMSGPEMDKSVTFTSFGRRFAHACGLFDDPQ